VFLLVRWFKVLVAMRRRSVALVALSVSRVHVVTSRPAESRVSRRCFDYI